MKLSTENRWCIEACRVASTAALGDRGIVRVTRTIHRDLTRAEALALAAYLIAAANHASTTTDANGYDEQAAALENDHAVQGLIRSIAAAAREGGGWR